MGVGGFALLSRCFIQDNVFDKDGILPALSNFLIMVERAGHIV